MLSIRQIELLASPGLVRRAKKSLNNSTPTINEISASQWRYCFEGATGVTNLVEFDQSYCDCPATDICKHIVAVALTAIKGHNSEIFVPPILDLNALFELGGKVSCRQAYRFWSEKHLDYFECSESESIYCVKGSSNISLLIQHDHCELRWDDNLAVISSGHDLSAIAVDSKQVKDKLIAAILYTAINKRLIQWPKWLQKENELKSLQYREKRHQLMCRVIHELTVLIDKGIAGLMTTNMIGLVSLMPDLKHIGDVSIANRISTLSTLIGRRESGHGLDTSGEILTHIASLYAACESSNETPPKRNHFISNVNLICLGGHQWFVSSGASGLSMVFLSEDGQIYSASIARSPSHRGAFSPEEAWSSEKLWQTGFINKDFPGKYFSLENSTYDEWGKLSLSQKTNCQLETKENFKWKCINNWQDLKLMSDFSYALLKVNRWLACEFDEKSQVLFIQLEDDYKQILSVSQKYTQHTQYRIANLIEHWNLQASHLLVRYSYQENAHVFEPISMYTDKWISLDFVVPRASQLSLLTKVAAKVNRKDLRHLPPENDLFNLLLTLEAALNNYPNCNQQELNAIRQRLRALGLDLIEDKLALIDSGPKHFLQLIYMLGLMKKSCINWPIF